MPLNESKGKTRERYPLAFDLEGIPRDQRDTLLRQTQEHLMDGVPHVNNSFTSDKGGGLAFLSEEQKATLLDELLKSAPTGRQIDLNNPPRVPYTYREFPKVLYAKTATPANHSQRGQNIVVQNKAEEEKLLKKGWLVKIPVTEIE